MTTDEVIAANVRRIREANGLSVTGLAARLGVGRHAVYDYEQPREEGGVQRPFRWSELVALCAVLEVSLFELVLPPEGVDVEEFSWWDPDADGRARLGMILFHLPGPYDEKFFDVLEKYHQSEEERTNDLVRSIVEQIVQQKPLPWQVHREGNE